MKRIERIVDVDVLFYENKRKTPPHGNTYRPHFVVEGSGDCYLGIQFIDLQKTPLGERISAKAVCIFPHNDYLLLTENARFLIMEGTHAVGEGIVLKRYIVDKARIYVDFNEMVASDVVMLSQGDCKLDSHGNMIKFYEGMSIGIYSDDNLSDDGVTDNLIADGVATQYDLSATPFSHVKWCCKINEKGILLLSDVKFEDIAFD